MSLRLWNVADNAMATRILKLDAKLTAVHPGSSKLTNLRVNGLLVTHWPEGIMPLDALRYLEWDQFLVLTQQLDAIGAVKCKKEPKAAAKTRAKLQTGLLALVHDAKARRTTSGVPQNLIDFNLTSFSAAEVRCRGTSRCRLGWDLCDDE